MMFKNNGFTLIELMVVVLVIGILAGMALPNLLNMKDRARESEVQSNAHTVQLAVESYGAINEGIYSTAAGDILPHLPGTALLRNSFTGLYTEPHFGQAAAAPGEIGVEPVLDNGIIVGYTISAFGKDGNILVLETGN
jgi:prepilin-type N-terminal cleavage/methylation domain-containing protein|nr:type II secretion system protein [Candidatus Krumholzibacteria bacterium]